MRQSLIQLASCKIIEAEQFTHNPWVIDKKAVERFRSQSRNNWKGGMGIGEGQDDHYNLSLNGDSCIISREMDKKIIRWQEFIFVILSRSESRIH